MSFGAFVISWENEFNSNRSTISLVGFTSYVVYAISQPYIGNLADRYSIRVILSFSILLIGISIILTFFATNIWQLMFLYGVLASFGFGGASNVVGSVIIMNWFNKKRGFALGLMSTGIAGGQLVLVPVSMYLIEQFGWKDTVLLLGILLSVAIFPIVLFFIRSFPSDNGKLPFGREEIYQNEKNRKQTTRRKITTLELIRNKNFLFLVIPFFVCGVTDSGLIDTHLIPFAEEHGFPAVFTGSVIILLAVFNIIGTITAGYLSDRWSCKNILVFLYGVRAISIFILLMITNKMHFFGLLPSPPYLLVIFSIVFGLVDFATVSPVIKLATNYFKNYSIGWIIGWLFFSHQMGAAIGSYIPGILYDLTGSYDISFLYSIVLLIGVSLMSYKLPSEDNVKEKVAITANN